MVVYFRTPAALDSCLGGLREQQPQPQVIVVDNSSTIDGVNIRPAPGVDWEWLRMNRNAGFGAAANAGARQAASGYVLVLNGDVVLEPGACAALVAALDRDPEAAVAGPRIIDAAGKVELSARSFPTVRTGALGRSSLLTRLFQRAGRAPVAVAHALEGEAGPVDWVSGACMLLRRQAFEQVAGFDERFWMYWEDADLCLRLARTGWRTRYVPEAVVHHATGSSGSSEVTIRAFHESAALYFATHLTRSAAGGVLGKGLLALRCQVVLARGRLANRSSP